MTSEKSQIKFAKSERTGELIGFVSRDSKTRQLKGVRENYALSKQICALAEALKGSIEPNILYSVGGFYKLGRGDFENYFEQIF